MSNLQEKEKIENDLSSHSVLEISTSMVQYTAIIQEMKSDSQTKAAQGDFV